MDPVPSKHWTWSQQAQQDEKESSLVKEILSDDEKLLKSWEEAEKASKEKASAPSTSDQQSSLGEGSGSVSEEFDHQEPGKEEGKELAVKEVSFTKLNTKDTALMKALSKARDLCYQQDNLSVQYAQGAIMNISSTPTAAQIHDRKLFKLRPPGNCVMDDIHSHWESYLYDFGALANAPYSQFHPKEGFKAEWKAKAYFLTSTQPGKIPTSEEGPKKLFSYRNPLYNKPSMPPPKISDPILPIPCRDRQQVEKDHKEVTPVDQEESLPLRMTILSWITPREIRPSRKCQNRRLSPRRQQSPLEMSCIPPDFQGGTWNIRMTSTLFWTRRGAL